MKAYLKLKEFDRYANCSDKAIHWLKKRTEPRICLKKLRFLLWKVDRSRHTDSPKVTATLALKKAKILSAWTRPSL